MLKDSGLLTFSGSMLQKTARFSIRGIVLTSNNRQTTVTTSA